MSILTFQIPDEVFMLESDDFYGKFEFRPLEPGFGITIGNALRRILLSSLEGFAITQVRIDGVSHEFSTIDGVVEDVVDIILNFKKIRFKQINHETNSSVVNISINAQEVFTAGDLNKFMLDFQVLNPDQVICHLNPSVKLKMEIHIEKGRGYVMAEDNVKPDNQPIGTIAMDAIFTPVRNVKYWIENYRVEQKTDFEKLIIEIQTDGSINPKTALSEAAKILIQHFRLFSDDKIVMEAETKKQNVELSEIDKEIKQLLMTNLNDLNFSVRALNCLKSSDIQKLKDLVTYKKTDLLKFRNFGKKSLLEVEQFLSSNNLSLGMDISKYNLNKNS